VTGRRIVRGVWSALTSSRTAVTLLLLIAAFCITATLIPPDRSRGALGIFSSWPFVLLCAALASNLACCAARRFILRLRHRARLRLGPDLVHLGLLVLMVAGVLTAAGRREGIAWLAEGDSVRLPDGSSLRLLAFDFESYPDGRPKEWVSTVEVSRDDRVLIPSFDIEVNRPLRAGGLRLYQSEWDAEEAAILVDATGKTITLHQGRVLSSGSETLVFNGIDAHGDGNEGRFSRATAGGEEEELSLAIGSTVAGLRLESIEERLFSGLMAVKDTGFAVAVAGALIMAAGLALWAAQRARRER